MTGHGGDGSSLGSGLSFSIGPGVQEAMRQAGDEPRSHEQYTHDPATRAVLYSETHGRDALYRWTPADGVRVVPLLPAGGGAPQRSASSPSDKDSTGSADDFRGGGSSGGARPTAGAPGVPPARGPDGGAAPIEVSLPLPSRGEGAGGGVLTSRPWDREQRITAGFSTPAGWLEEFGVQRQVLAIVWHSMEGTLASALVHWNTGAAGAHLCVLRDGSVVLTCPLEYVAWGAGTHNRPGQDGYGRTLFWRTTNVNPFAVQVEMEGRAADGFGEAQVAGAIRVARWLTARYAIPARQAVDAVPGHHRHSDLSAARADPGPRFPLDRILAACRA